MWHTNICQTDRKTWSWQSWNKFAIQTNITPPTRDFIQNLAQNGSDWHQWDKIWDFFRSVFKARRAPVGAPFGANLTHFGPKSDNPPTNYNFQSWIFQFNRFQTKMEWSSYFTAHSATVVELWRYTHWLGRFWQKTFDSAPLSPSADDRRLPSTCSRRGVWSRALTLRWATLSELPRHLCWESLWQQNQVSDEQVVLSTQRLSQGPEER